MIGVCGIIGLPSSSMLHGVELDYVGIFPVNNAAGIYIYSLIGSINGHSFK